MGADISDFEKAKTRNHLGRVLLNTECDFDSQNSGEKRDENTKSTVSKCASSPVPKPPASSSASSTSAQT